MSRRRRRIAWGWLILPALAAAVLAYFFPISSDSDTTTLTAWSLWALLTSRSRDSERDHLAIGTGAWDEASALPRESFERVSRVLAQRYGWTIDAG